MTKEEIEAYIKELLLENMSVEVSINPEPYSDGQLMTIRVNIIYDGVEINSYGDTIRVNG